MKRITLEGNKWRTFHDYYDKPEYPPKSNVLAEYKKRTEYKGYGTYM